MPGIQNTPKGIRNIVAQNTKQKTAVQALSSRNSRAFRHPKDISVCDYQDNRCQYPDD
jgi:hypothetical protein